MIPSGAATSPPFARGGTAPPPETPPTLNELKRKYFALHDRAARFALLKDRPEPEAQYLAYRAFHECGRVMSTLQDGNDLGYRLRQSWAERNVSDRAVREAALERWTGACAGFLRPNPDVRREAEALLRQSAHAGHVGARALAFDGTGEVDTASAVTLARAIVESRDPLAMFDGQLVMLQARRACNAGERLMEDHVAWILASCRLTDCYRTELFFSEALCALRGACEQKSIEPAYLDEARSDVDRQWLVRRIDELERLMREGRTQDLLPCTGS